MPPIGSHVDRLNGVDLYYIRVHFVMQSSSGMGGHHLIFYRAVCEVTFSVLHAHSCPVGGFVVVVDILFRIADQNGQVCPIL